MIKSGTGIGVSSQNIQKAISVSYDAATHGPIQMVYDRVFMKFDKDNSGYLNFYKFVDL